MESKISEVWGQMEPLTGEPSVAALNRQRAEIQAQLEQRAMAPKATFQALEQAYEAMKANKPNDRSELDRCWAIAVTDMQKLVAFFKVYVAGL